jgi:L-aspartate oxidase
VWLLYFIGIKFAVLSDILELDKASLHDFGRFPLIAFMEKLFTDVLILGSGAAGIRAASAAHKAGAKVILVSRTIPTRGGSSFSDISKGWGVQGLVGSERTESKMVEFFEDILRIGLGRVDTNLAQILVEESGRRIEDLMFYGIQFKKDENSRYLRVKGCFSDYKRAYITAGLGNIRQSFLSILRRISVRIVTGSAIDLVTVDGACLGAWILTNSGEIVQINAKATVLASGGGAAVYRHHLVDDDQVGDGYALAHRAGAGLTNLEFIQFMLGLKCNGQRKFLPLGELKDPNAFLDSNGMAPIASAGLDSPSRDAAVEKRQAHLPFSSRDASVLIDVAMARASQNGNKVYWQKNGSNNQKSEVVHFAHAFNGGVRINANAESNVPGLFAAGEVAAGPHGADRIGGCMMTATQVFGRRAGHFAALRAKKINKQVNPKHHLPDYLNCTDQCTAKPVSQKIDRIAQSVKKDMSEHAAVIRTEEGLINCLNALINYDSQLDSLNCVSNCELKRFVLARHMTTTAKLVTDAALSRKKSCGSHYREDSL